MKSIHDGTVVSLATVAQSSSPRRAGPSAKLGAQLGNQIVEVERGRAHLNPFAVRRHRPLLARAVPVELDPVAVGVGQVEGLADAVVGSAFERPAGLAEAAEGGGEGAAGRIADRRVEEAGAAGGRRRAAFGAPGVKPDVV